MSAAPMPDPEAVAELVRSVREKGADRFGGWENVGALIAELGRPAWGYPSATRGRHTTQDEPIGNLLSIRIDPDARLTPNRTSYQEHTARILAAHRAYEPPRRSRAHLIPWALLALSTTWNAVMVAASGSPVTAGATIINMGTLAVVLIARSRAAAESRPPE